MNHSGIVDLVPADIRDQWIKSGIYPNKSLFQLFYEQAQRQPDKPAVVSPEQTISYGELQHKVACLAASLHDLGVVAGDVIAYQLSNSWYHCAIDLAAAMLGAIVAPYPPGRGLLDTQSLLSRCDARVIIVEPGFGELDICRMIESLRPALLSLRNVIRNYLYIKIKYLQCLPSMKTVSHNLNL
ncbi:MAG: AMP-binding protein [Nitrosomonas sp.]|nr:MAG: AMP-binding protein [Nitrosomonas sp.]